MFAYIAWYENNKEWLRPIITCMDEYDKKITKKQFIKYFWCRDILSMLIGLCIYFLLDRWMEMGLQ